MRDTHTSAEASDEELITRMNSCDERAFELLYYRHREWVLRMAWRITGSQQLAEDVSQEVFCYFLTKFPGFELRCKLTTFLYPAIRNLSLASLRKKKRYIGGDPGAAVIDQLTATNNQVAGHHDFHQLVSSLSPDHREIIMLRFVDGMTLPEIAQLVGIPLGTAKSRLHHSLAALRADPKIKNLEEPVNDCVVEIT